MGEERRGQNSVDHDQNLQDVDVYYDNPENPELDVVQNKYHEESSAEITTPMGLSNQYERDSSEETNTSGRVLGYSALALSILSLFFLPILLGAAGIVLGFVARRRGSEMLGAWAIGIGVVSIIIGIFVLPFF
ncbi:lipopolysaccharide export LptBFGC system permease protein LptF [Bacillus pakistanensis]|uniref:Lipopolysaccharide export LptBFGC system permease protein LptF n=1 Tax=Rossellomorea pakistanensis TaxID=992288 RepID=A0ABS2NA34_9BACI|nr:DUF4190 domain-containing protein [Bacillus pakistanensis]MBM7584695.1 lipopolysaccharide export LptBFGC system permease protein LptF [Bacillus pakistanensis]